MKERHMGENGSIELDLVTDIVEKEFEEKL